VYLHTHLITFFHEPASTTNSHIASGIFSRKFTTNDHYKQNYRTSNQHIMLHHQPQILSPLNEMDSHSSSMSNLRARKMSSGGNRSWSEEEVRMRSHDFTVTTANLS
jgi:hypothetical protein